MAHAIARSSSQEHLAAGVFSAESGSGLQEEAPPTDAVAARTSEVAKVALNEPPVRVGRFPCCSGCLLQFEAAGNKRYGCTLAASWSCSLITVVALAILFGTQYDFR